MSKRITPKSLNALGFIIMSLPSLRHFVSILKQTLFLVLFTIRIQENGKSKHSLFLLIYMIVILFTRKQTLKSKINYSLFAQSSFHYLLNNTLINSSELHDLFLTNKNCLLIYQNLKLRRYKTFSNCC